MPTSKRFKGLQALIDPKKVYSATEAVELVKKTSTIKFDGSIEAHINLGIDVKKSDQQIRATLTFPNSIGKSKKVCAFVPEIRAGEAKEAGADLVGAEDIIDAIAQTGKIDFDIAVATPDMMPKLAKIAKVLGPKGLMPNPKTDTVGPNIKKIIEDLKKGKVAFKNDGTGNVHQIVGKSSLEEAKILENLKVFVEAVRKAKPASAKGTFIRSLTLTSTMGPGIKVDANSIVEAKASR